MLRMKISWLFFITLIFYFLGEFCFKLGSFAIPFYFIIGSLYIIFILLKYPKTFFKRLMLLYKLRVGKYLLFFIIWVILSIVFSMIQGTFIPKSFLSNFIGNFFCSFLFPLILGVLSIGFVSSKVIKKYLFVLFLVVLSLGVIEYIAITYEISLIRDFFSLFVNRTSINYDLEKTFVFAFEKARASSIFREPGEFAGFLVVSSPIFYYFYKTKEQFFKFKFIDDLLRKLVIVLFLMNLILTQSPINLVFFCMILIVYILPKIKEAYQKFKIYFVVSILLLMFTLLVLFSNKTTDDIDISDTYLSRISTVAKNFTSINKLMDAEPSLGTRICGQEAMLYMGLDNPIFGVGYANIDSKWPQYVLNLKHHITLEVYNYAKKGKQAGAGSYMFKIIAETGLVGLLLLYLFWISLFLQGIKYARYSKDVFWVKSLAYSLLIYIIYSFYLWLAPIFMVYFGLLIYEIASIKINSLRNNNLLEDENG